HAIGRAALAPGHRVAVIGAGGIGLLLIQALHAEGYEVDAIGRSAQSRAEAVSEGASAALTPDEAAAGPQERYHRIFDLVGTAASTGLAGAIVARRGHIVMIGEEPEFPAIDTIRLAQKEIELVGSRNGAKADAEAALRLMQAGILRPKIADVVPLSDVNAAFDRLRAGGVLGRIIVEPGR
ncbi:MAG: zinc-binding dehydrogenase, partial [Rhizobiales bacterium]|nr:zinc-binding dehydrogenase [Hyphomicrobiales bacterium]